MLAHSSAVFSIDLQVPDEQDLYGQSAGRSLPVVGFICYPTPDDNPRADYQFPDTEQPIPHMQQPGEEPLFADSRAKYPLLVYSHGHSSHPMSDPQILALTRLASQGYVVLALFHGDDRFPDDSPLTGYNQLPLRPLALKAALDQLESDPLFGSHIDWERVGAIGVSYGGATVLAASGARLTDLRGWGLLDPAHDSRLRAAAGVVSFCGLGVVPLFGLDYSGASYLGTPQIIVCGELDPVAPCSLSRKTLEASGQRGYLITVAGQGHLMNSEALYDANYWSLLFLDAYVKVMSRPGRSWRAAGTCPAVPTTTRKSSTESQAGSSRTSPSGGVKPVTRRGWVKTVARWRRMKPTRVTPRRSSRRTPRAVGADTEPTRGTPARATLRAIS